MKKRLFLLIAILILPVVVKAELTDTTGPELNSYSFSDSIIYNNKTTNITIDANDDISGARIVEFTFVDTSKNYITDYNAVLHIQVNITNGQQTYVSNPINRANPGNYSLMTATIEDANMNRTCYITSEFAGKINNCTNTINGYNITLKDAEDAKFSHIKSVSVSKNNITPGEGVDLNLTLEDDEAKYVTVWYDSGLNISFTNTNNSTSFNKTIYDFKTPGKTYKLIEITIISKSGNQTVYINNPNVGVSGAEIIRTLDLSKYNITVSGEIDNVKPELESIEVVNSKVYAPGILKFKIRAKDNIANNIKRVQVDIKGKDENITYGYCSDDKWDGDEHICTVEINQYTKTGKYYISGVVVVDKSDNTTIYSTTPIDDYKKLDNIEFEIDTDTKSDVISSTENDEVINKINKTSDTAVISIDSTRNPIVKKEIFDSIKGTNKKLLIESNGIQWIFLGSNINNETKDINAKVTIEQKEATDEETAIDSINSLVINFAPNGKLPGPCKIRIKADYALRNFIGTTDLYVYFYDEENEIFDPVAQKIDMTSDGYYEFYIEHNSIYIISNTIPKAKYISKNKAGLQLNKSSNTEDFNINEEDIEIIEIKTEEEKTISEKNVEKPKKFNILFVLVPILIILSIGITVIIIIKRRKKK